MSHDKLLDACTSCKGLKSDLDLTLVYVSYKGLKR